MFLRKILFKLSGVSTLTTNLAGVRLSNKKLLDLALDRFIGVNVKKTKEHIEKLRLKRKIRKRKPPQTRVEWRPGKPEDLGWEPYASPFSGVHTSTYNPERGVVPDEIDSLLEEEKENKDKELVSRLGVDL